VPVDYIHDPWNMPEELQKSVKVSIGIKGDYPQPIACTKYTSEEASMKMKRASPANGKKRSGSLPMKK